MDGSGKHATSTQSRVRGLSRSKRYPKRTGAGSVVFARHQNSCTIPILRHYMENLDGWALTGSPSQRQILRPKNHVLPSPPFRMHRETEWGDSSVSTSRAYMSIER